MVVLKKKTFEYVLCISTVKTLDPLVQGHLGPWDLCFNKLGKGPQGMQCYIPNFKHLSKVVLKKIFEYFSMYFYSYLWPLWRSHLGPCSLNLNKLGKRPLGNAIYQISSIWPKCFWRRRFFNILFVCISIVQPQTPGRGHLGSSGLLWNW